MSEKITEVYSDANGYITKVDGVSISNMVRVESLDPGDMYAPLRVTVSTSYFGAISLSDEVSFILDRDGVDELRQALSDPDPLDNDEEDA